MNDVPSVATDIVTPLETMQNIILPYNRPERIGPKVIVAKYDDIMRTDEAQPAENLGRR